jgi:hypothetical protein
VYISEKKQVPEGKRMFICRGIENKDETKNEEKRN